MEYKNYLNKKKFSQNTKEAYLNDKKFFEDFLEDRNINDVDKSDVIKYIIHLTNEGYSDSSIARKMASLKSYFYYAINMGLIDRDPTFDIEPIKVKKAKTIEPLDKELLESFIKKPLESKGYNFSGMRDSLIFKLTYETGINMLDLLDKKISDINLEIGYLVHDEEYFYFDDELLSLFKKYTSFLKDNFKANNFLFINTNGNKLSRQGVWKIFKKYSLEMKLEEDITSQVLINNHTYYK